MSDTYKVLKIDIDVHIPLTWLEEWIETRKWICESNGLEVTKVRFEPTEHGYHVWIHLDREIDYELMAKLQFLCGDDHNRCYFTQQRKGFKKLRSKFNILFNRKWDVEQNVR
jgi:hypothetical protein